MKSKGLLIAAVLVIHGHARASIDIPVEIALQKAIYRHNVGAQTVYGSDDSDNPALDAGLRAKLYFARALTDERGGQHFAAVNHYSRSLDFKFDASGLIYRGRVFRKIGDLTASARDLHDALRLEPGDARAWLDLGYTDFEKGSYSESETDLTRAIVFGSRAPGAYALRGNVYNIQHRYQDALVDFDAAIALAPDNSMAHVGRAKTLVKLKRNDEAISELNGVLKRSPTDSEALLERGIVWQEKKNAGNSAQDLNAAARLNTTDDRAHTYLGFLYFDSKDYRGAIEEFSLAIKLAPSNVVARRMRAASYEAIGQPAVAIADYSVAIQLRPGEARTYLLRAGVFESQGNLVDANRDIDHAYRIAPTDRDIYWRRARISEKTGDNLSAIAAYSSILKLEPGSFEAYVYRGDDLRALGHYDDAQRDYDIAARMQPDRLQLIHGQGMLAFYRGQYPEARDYFSRWLALSQAGRTDESVQQLPYIVLWRHLANLRLHFDDRQALAFAVSGFDQSKWPYPIIAYFLGKIDRARLLAMAESGETKMAQSCEANAYLGTEQISRAQGNDGAVFLREAVDSCPPNFIEKELATRELENWHKLITQHEH